MPDGQTGVTRLGSITDVAGIRVGTVNDVKLLADRNIQVDFDAKGAVVGATWSLWDAGEQPRC